MRRLWRLIDARAWDDLAAVFAPDVSVLYVHTGERMDREGYVALNREYPGVWQADVLDVVASEDRAAARVRVWDDEQAFHTACFVTVADGCISEMIEVWTDESAEVPTDRRPGRA